MMNNINEMKWRSNDNNDNINDEILMIVMIMKW